jgi:hypothetical protein
LWIAVSLHRTEKAGPLIAAAVHAEENLTTSVRLHSLHAESTAMTPWQNRVTDLTQRMADDMKLRNYSQKTIDAYTYHVGRFAQFLVPVSHFSGMILA